MRGCSLFQLLLYILLFYEEIKKRIFGVGSNCVCGRHGWQSLLLLRHLKRIPPHFLSPSPSSLWTSFTITVSLPPPLQQNISWSLLRLLVMVIYRNTSPLRRTEHHYTFFAIILPIKLDPFSGNYILARVTSQQIGKGPHSVTVPVCSICCCL